MRGLTTTVVAAFVLSYSFIALGQEAPCDDASVSFSYAGDVDVPVPRGTKALKLTLSSTEQFQFWVDERNFSQLIKTMGSNISGHEADRVWASRVLSTADSLWADSDTICERQIRLVLERRFSGDTSLWRAELMLSDLLQIGLRSSMVAVVTGSTGERIQRVRRDVFSQSLDNYEIHGEKMIHVSRERFSHNGIVLSEVCVLWPAGSEQEFEDLFSN